MLKTIIFVKSSETKWSSADAALSPIAVFDIEIN